MKVKEIVLIAILSASLTVGKLALSFIPNVEIVTLLFICYTLSLGIRRTLFISVIFTITDILIWGFSTWVLGYFIAWPALIIITNLFKNKIRTEYGYAILSGLFGFTFGLYFAFFESLFYGAAHGLAYVISNIPFDVIHGASNFIIGLFLVKPISGLLHQLSSRLLNQSI